MLMGIMMALCTSLRDGCAREQVEHKWKLEGIEKRAATVLRERLKQPLNKQQPAQKKLQ